MGFFCTYESRFFFSFLFQQNVCSLGCSIYALERIGEKNGKKNISCFTKIRFTWLSYICPGYLEEEDVWVLRRELLVERGHLLARAAPRGSEVHLSRTNAKQQYSGANASAHRVQGTRVQVYHDVLLAERNGLGHDESMHSFFSTSTPERRHGSRERAKAPITSKTINTREKARRRGSRERGPKHPRHQEPSTPEERATHGTRERERAKAPTRSNHQHQTERHGGGMAVEREGAKAPMTSKTINTRRQGNARQ